jgi:transposase-like protein
LPVSAIRRGRARASCDKLPKSFRLCPAEFHDRLAFRTPLPRCGSTAISRKGTRRKKIEIVQLWRCASCKRVFTPTPAALRDKTYPLRIVLDAITLFDLGYTLEQVADKMQVRHGHRVGRSTIAAWLAEHRSLTTYSRLRADGRRLFPPAQAIRSVKLYHQQIYKFAYHRPKLAMLRESREHRRFAGVADILERVPIECQDQSEIDSRGYAPAGDAVPINHHPLMDWNSTH